MGLLHPWLLMLLPLAVLPWVRRGQTALPHASLLLIPEDPLSTAVGAAGPAERVPAPEVVPGEARPEQSLAVELAAPVVRLPRRLSCCQPGCFLRPGQRSWPPKRTL